MKKYNRVYNVVISEYRTGMIYGMTMYLIHSLKKRYAKLLGKIYMLKLLALKIDSKDMTGK